MIGLSGFQDALRHLDDVSMNLRDGHFHNLLDSALLPRLDLDDVLHTLVGISTENPARKTPVNGTKNWSKILWCTTSNR